MAIVKCAHCPTNIDTMKDSYYSAVPKVGALCLPCHKTWMAPNELVEALASREC